MAKEVAVRKPLLIGLQEASILRTGSPPASTVVFDLPQLLLQELAKLGENYTAAAAFVGPDVEAPSTLGFDVRLTSQDVILVRTDPQLGLSYSNVQVHPYATQLVVPLPVGSVTFTRGWASIDVIVKGQPFRFVTTHLDTEAVPPIQAAQATELVQTAGNTHLPIIYAADFNTPANNPSSPAFGTYQVMLGSGVQDVWSVANPFDPGLTCCQAQNDRNPVSQLSERSDLIFASAAFQIERAKLVGQRPQDRTTSGLWPSDHAGVVAALCLDARSIRMSCTIDTLADTQ